MFEFTAAFDKPTAERMETTAQQSAQQNGIDRRIALAILTRSPSELRQSAAENPEAVSEEGAGVQSGELEQAAHE